MALGALTRSDFETATRYARRLDAAGEASGDDVLVVEAAYVLGIASFWQADFAGARTHLERAVDRYRPADRQTHLIRYGQDPKVICLARLANTNWFLGRPEAALTASTAALAWADEIGHPNSRGGALSFAALLALDMGAEAALRAHAATLVSVAPQTPHLRLVADAFDGYCRVLDGQGTVAIADLRAGIRTASGVLTAPGLLAVLHRVLLGACLAADDVPGALAAADQLLELCGAAIVWAAEAHRVRAELTARID